MHPRKPIASAIKHGYRSGLEEAVGEQLSKAGVAAAYEKEKIGYLKPSRQSKYTPDWVLPNGIIIETKGRFLTDDRQKHLLIKAQYPDLDIRFVFSTSKARISKGSNTTYSMWCVKHGFQYADKLIPEEWLRESPDPKRLEAINKAKVQTK